jgi:hypothetical protein
MVISFEIGTLSLRMELGRLVYVAMGEDGKITTRRRSIFTFCNTEKRWEWKTGQKVA